MKVVILAGGLGTRLSEETGIRPKPMVEIGGKPLIWHILKIYSSQGFNDFIICLGYKGYIIKEYFSNYFLHTNDVSIDLLTGKINIESYRSENMKLNLIDTGISTQTGGRIKIIEKNLGKETFMLTYGDGVADINLNTLLEFHKNHGKLATVTAVRPPGRFGTLTLNENSKVKKFEEKPKGDGNWINGGFFVLEPGIIKYIEGEDTYWEKEPMLNLAKNGELYAYKHNGFWKPMDTLRDKIELENYWASGKAPWKIW